MYWRLQMKFGVRRIVTIQLIVARLSVSQNSSLQGKVKVVASFYPILEFVKKVGGDKVEVSSLIPVGIEPHDFEATIQQIQNAETADMLVFNGVGFEGQRIKDIDAKFVLDTSKGLNLTSSTNGYVDDGCSVI